MGNQEGCEEGHKITHQEHAFRWHNQVTVFQMAVDFLEDGQMRTNTDALLLLSELHGKEWVEAELKELQDDGGKQKYSTDNVIEGTKEESTGGEKKESDVVEEQNKCEHQHPQEKRQQCEVQHQVE